MYKRPLIRSAYSAIDGITIFSKRNKRYVARAILTDNNTIVYSYEKEYTFLQWLANHLITYVLPIILFTLLILLPSSSDSTSKEVVVSTFLKEIKGLVFILISTFIFVRYLIVNLKVMQTHEGQSLARFHSAEHMLINAVNKLRRVPTLSELMEFSNYSKYCGEQEKNDLIWLFLLLGIQEIFFNNTSLEALLALGIGYVILFILKKLGFLSFLQRISLLPPTETELTVALVAANEWASHEFQTEK